MHIAGWLGTEHQAYAEEQFAKLRTAGLTEAFKYHCTIDRLQKQSFLRDLDLFSVPTTYREPKGRSALEAMASGLAVVLPDHGAFSELIAETKAGVLVRPEDPSHLTEVIGALLDDPTRCAEFGRCGMQSITNGLKRPGDGQANSENLCTCSVPAVRSIITHWLL